MNRCIRSLCLFFVLLALGVILVGADGPVKQDQAKQDPAKTEKSAPAAPGSEKAKKESAKSEKSAPAENAKKEPAKEPAKSEKEKSASAAPAEAAKKEPAKTEESAPPPATETVKKAIIKITVDLEGVFEGEDAREIAVPAKEWTALEVHRAVSHGAVVRKGDVVLEIETEKLDRAIADLQTDLKIAELASAETERQFQMLEKTSELELAAGQRSAVQTEEDLKFYFETLRPLLVKAADFELNAAKQAYEYEQEELRQLEKMYKADDITEETEEIVLRRARDTLERAKFAADTNEIIHNYTVSVVIPRRDVEMKESARRTELAWEHAKALIPETLKKQRLELEKMRTQRMPAQEKLKRLLADRQLMTVRAPIDGTVFYGKFSRGRSADAASLVESLRPHGTIAAEQVVMTVISRRPTCIRTMVPENQLHDLRPGVKGIAVPTARPDADLPVTIDRVGDLPMSPGNFDARLSVVLPEKIKWLVPGLTCKVTLIPYLKKDALCVPPKVLIPDELDSRKQYVMLLEKNGKTAKRPVTVGRQTEKQVEILGGLSEGDKVLAEPNK
jgi:HlyD family secretion protein